MMALEENTYTDLLKKWHMRYPDVEAVVLFTAHWEAPVQQISRVGRYDTIHDFYGFPEELCQIQYPAPGHEELAARVRDLFRDRGIASGFDAKRGLDHGSWSVLHHLYPQANMPVVQLSVNIGLDPRQQYEIGKALAPLRRDNVLILGSGGTVHNLRALKWGQEEAEPWAVSFDDWLDKRLQTWNVEELARYESLAPHAPLAVPRSEHFVPLLLAMGAADGERTAASLHRSYQLGSLSLAAWEFGQQD